MVNGTSDYKLGELSQAVEDIRTDVKDIKLKLDDLRLWKAKAIGFSSAIGAIVSATISFLIKKL